MLLLIGWMLLTIPVFVIGGAAISNRLDGWGVPATNKSVIMTTVLVLPAWWGLYFVIAAICAAKTF